MADLEVRKRHAGVRHVSIAVDSNTSFKDLVSLLEKTLVVPDLPGIRGCAPCLSGLDRFVIEDAVLPATR